jgi:hypothetical protein
MAIKNKMKPMLLNRENHVKFCIKSWTVAFSEVAWGTFGKVRRIIKYKKANTEMTAVRTIV